MAPSNIKEEQRSPVIKVETAAASGVPPAARAQPVSVLPRFILSILQSCFSKVVLTALIDCIAAHKNPRYSSYELYCKCALAVR